MYDVKACITYWEIKQKPVYKYSNKTAERVTHCMLGYHGLFASTRWFDKENNKKQNVILLVR